MAAISSRFRWRALRVWLVLIVLISSLFGVVATHAAATCTVTYKVINQWDVGFQGDVTIANSGAAINSWTLTYAYPNGQTIYQLWGGTYTQSGANVSVTNLD